MTRLIYVYIHKSRCMASIGRKNGEQWRQDGKNHIVRRKTMCKKKVESTNSEQHNQCTLSRGMNTILWPYKISR